MKNEKFKSLGAKSVWLILVGFIMVGVLVSYAFLGDILFTGQKEHSISTCGVNMLLDDKNPITLIAAMPVSDATALTYSPYQVKVKNNDSSCQTINFALKMENLCNTCTKVDNVCTVGTNSCNCLSAYQIDPALIKYQVKNVTTGAVINGSNPFNINVASLLPTGTSEVNFEIRLWINETATSNDLNVKVGETYITNPDGSNVTKNFCSKLKVDVTAQ